MPITLKVRSNDIALQAQRKRVVERVIDCFAENLPPSRLLCFFDDEDPLTLKQVLGTANRGVYGPIHDNTPMADWPEYVTDCIYVDDGISLLCQRSVDDLVYLYGSAWTNETGMKMTLAHELQHVVQHGNARQLWAVNSLIRQLPEEVIAALKLQWADIPTEREARIVSKRVALDLCGEVAVDAYIRERIADAVDAHDVADWCFIRDLTPSDSIDLNDATRLLFRRLIDYRAELEELMLENSNNSDFSNVNVEKLFD